MNEEYDVGFLFWAVLMTGPLLFTGFLAQAEGRKQVREAVGLCAIMDKSAAECLHGLP